MDKSEYYVSRTEKLLEKVRKQIDFTVIKTEYVNEDGINYLRVYCDMDQPGGIGADDCARIARPLSKLLDKENFIEDDNYTLEVCSPGFLIPAQTEPDEEGADEEDNADPDGAEDESVIAESGAGREGQKDMKEETETETTQEEEKDE